MQNFGDLFFIDSNEYVYLFADGKIVYAAVILNQEHTNEVKRLRTTADKRGVSHKNPMFCYVELDTEDYSNCSANMLSVSKGIEMEVASAIRPSNKKLIEEDLKKIKDEILTFENLFRPALVEYMKGITL